MNQTPSPAAFSAHDVASASERFIERMGDHMEAEGMPRIAGRLFGLLLVDGGPISFSDLADRLDVSRGSISTNARLLETKGLIERVSRPGERGDFFRLADAPFVNMIRGVATRMRETMTLIEESCLEFPEGGACCERIAATRHFFAETVATLDALAARLAAQPVEGYSR